jgi:transposase-like protein
MASKKTYTREFKEEALSLAHKNGNITETAPRLGLHESILMRVFLGGGRKSWRITRRKPFRVRDIARMKNYGSYSRRISG